MMDATLLMRIVGALIKIGQTVAMVQSALKRGQHQRVAELFRLIADVATSVADGVDEWTNAHATG